MIISIASGKGGTGKTTVAVNLATMFDENIQFLDCDVEEPNAHIFLKPSIERQIPIFLKFPKVDYSKCNFCGLCAKECNFNALSVIKPTEKMNGMWIIFEHLCHGCGVCSYFCPQQALSEKEEEIGKIRLGKSNNIIFMDGTLNVGEAISPPIIKEMKKKIDKNKITIIDAPPGTTCPMVEAVKDSDFCLLITEPTPFGIHDLKLAVEVVKNLKIDFGIIINKAGIGDKKIYEYCKRESIDIIEEIPFEKEKAKAYSEEKILVKHFPDLKSKFENIKKYILEKRRK